jgi:uncharacterized protein (TIRG00374 family)
MGAIIRYPFGAHQAYFASMFLGFLTPGRLGEFVKAWYVSQACKVSSGLAFSSVLADRLFDLYIVLMVGCAAVAGVYAQVQLWIVLGSLVILLAFFLLVVLDERWFFGLRRLVSVSKWVEQTFFKPGGWLEDIQRYGITWRGLLVAALLTTLAYALYFGQCYLLSQALGLSLTVTQATYAVALGGLVTLLPVSISGLGTREAVIIAYLGRWEISSEAALSFSLLVFASSYLVGGLLGALAWWRRPLPGLLDRNSS